MNAGVFPLIAILMVCMNINISEITRVKVCGITTAEDCSLVVEAGADAIGFIFYKKSARFVETPKAREIMRGMPPFVSSVALFVDPQPDQVSDVIKSVQPDLLQFHGNESVEFCEQFDKNYIKAIRVHKNIDLIQLSDYYSSAKGLLLDSFVEGEKGGTGVTFDWELIPDELPCPIILAGGLNPNNVGMAISKVKPWAVDVSSGVEASPGVKDINKIKAFFQGVKRCE